MPHDQSLRTQILSNAHDRPYTGHMGITKTLKLIQRLFWWPELRLDVTQYIGSCEVCQRDKHAIRHTPGLLHPLPIPDRRWDSVSMDLITQLPITKSGHTAIVVFVDRLSKMAHFAPTYSSVDAVALVKLFDDAVFRLHGMPLEIVSERDPSMTSKFWSALCESRGIKQCMSTPYHPQSDGQTERVNRVLEDMLRHFVNPNQDDWDEHLSTAEFAYNNAWHESIGETPFMLNYSQHPRTPDLFGCMDNPVPQSLRYYGGMSDRLSKAKENLRAAQTRQKMYADKRRRLVTYQPGDWVMVSTRNMQMSPLRGTRKLYAKWIGPFEVVKAVNDVAYELNLPQSMSIHDVFHVSSLKPYKARDGQNVKIPPPMTLLYGDKEYEVEAILDHKADKGYENEYLVRWKGHPSSEDRWEPESNLRGSPDILRAYKMQHQL